ncbi:MAG: hypothetical protein D6756_08865 [Cyanobacteria bacterium J083]|nr:MAG: hypothetical protein D6756_08865 [Cyanobacteria bacterium J083]
MAQLLKRWESPRRQGRNDKGRGKTARLRQIKKRNKRLKQRLQAESKQLDKYIKPEGVEMNVSPLFFAPSL